MNNWIKLGIVLLILVIVAVIIGLRMYFKPHPDYEKAEAKFTMSANRLYNEFKTGQEGASKKYNGLVIAIDGTLGKVETADSLVVAVFVFNTGDFGDEGIRCTLLPDFNDKAKKLTPGSLVSIKGYCTGFNGTDVIMEKCSFPSP